MLSATSVYTLYDPLDSKKGTMNGISLKLSNISIEYAIQSKPYNIVSGTYVIHAWSIQSFQSRTFRLDPQVRKYCSEILRLNMLEARQTSFARKNQAQLNWIMLASAGWKLYYRSNGRKFE